MRRRVTACELPASSRLNARRAPGDFLDCYAVTATASPRRAAEIVVDFPPWARGLLAVRRLLTAPFGLSNDGPPAPDKLGPFPVEVDTDEELIAGFDDKHLDFRISIVSRDGRVHLATWVHTHNPGGCAYLAGIMPFHKLIVRDALRRVAAAERP